MLTALFRREQPPLPAARRCWSRSQGWSGMALVLGVLLWAGAAEAQQVGVNWNCNPPTANTNQTGNCPTSLAYPLPVGQEIRGWLPVAGTQRGLSIASSTALTVPAGATVALVQAQGVGATTGGACAFWQDDGTAPTGTAGQILVPNQTLALAGSSMTAFRVIAATGSGASCTLTASYYK